MAQSPNEPWWNADKADVHVAVCDAHKSLGVDHEDRLEAYRIWTKFFLNRELDDESITSYIRAATNVEHNKFSRVPFNGIRLVIDTVMSRVGKLTPRPLFQTYGGDYSFQTKAKTLQRWTDSQFYSEKVYNKAKQAFQDACVLGIGVMKVFPDFDRKKISYERVWPGEIVIDPLDGMYGDPRQIIQRKLVPRRVLQEMFPEHREELETVHKPSSRPHRIRDDGWHPSLDQLEVLEAWHLPTTSKSRDGRHVMVVDGVTLFDEEWKHDHFPFAFVRWSDEMRGFFGVGLSEILMGLHLDINQSIRRIERSMEMISRSKIVAPKGSGLSPKDFTNSNAEILFYAGKQAPAYLTPQANNPEVYAYLDSQISRLFQVSGLSSSTFGSRVPSGLETGEAVRSFHDIETERFSIPAKSFEEMFLDLARLSVAAGRQLAAKIPGYSVVAEKDRHSIERVKWSDINLSDDAYVLRVTAASALSLTTAGRIAQVGDLVDKGFIPPDVGARLLDFPDLDRHNTLENAASRNIDRMIELMLEEGKFTQPDPFMDLNLAIKKVQAAINHAQNMGVQEDRISLLRKYSRAANQLIQEAEAQAAMAAQPLPDQAPTPDAMGQMPTAITGEEPSPPSM